MRRTIVLTSALVAIATGCASGGGSAASPSPAASSSTAGAQGRKSSSTLITGDDLRATGLSNVFEAIQRLRPAWFRGRGTASPSDASGSGQGGTLPMAFLDDASYGDLTALRNIPVESVREVQYLGASEATQRFGTGHTGGVILVLSRR